MKKQSGFTLIELLLVLAIIGIISAIALPALLGQRARARDKTAVQGTIGRIADLVGQYDKGKEANSNGDTTPVTTLMNTWLATSIGAKDANPWGTSSTMLIFDTTSIDFTTMTTHKTKTAFDAALTTEAKALTVVGQGKGYCQLPDAAAGIPGFVGIGVKLDAKDAAGANLVQIKSVGIE